MKYSTLLIPAVTLASVLLSLALLSVSPVVKAVDLPEFDCLIEPELAVDVSSPVDGIIQKIYVDKSDVVTKGQKLAELDSGVKQAKVDLARARADMKEKIRARRANLGFAKRKWERIKNLYKKGAISPFLKDEAETEYKLAREELKIAKKEKIQAELELEYSIQELLQRTIRSPFDGVVVKRYLSIGETVEDTPLLRLAQVNPLRVEIIAPSELFGLIKKGMRAEILPESPNYGTHVATVSIVDKVIDAASGTFGIRLALPNKNYQLPGGLKCKARFIAMAETPTYPKPSPPIPKTSVQENLQPEPEPVEQVKSASVAKTTTQSNTIVRTAPPVTEPTVSEQLTSQDMPSQLLQSDSQDQVLGP